MKQLFRQKYGQWALVTGAAEGLGAAFAEALASRKLNVFLVDIQAEKMKDLAEVLSMTYGIQTAWEVCDLTAPDFYKQLSKSIKELDIGLLVCSAGKSKIGRFFDTALRKQLEILDLNIRSTLVLTHHFGKRFITQGKGGIIIVSSLSALVGTSIISNYAASKAYNLILAEGLAQELKEYNIDVLGLVLGATNTPGYRHSKINVGTGPKKIMEPGKVAHKTLKRLGKNTLFVPGYHNLFNYFFISRVLPRKWSVQLISNVLRKMYD